MEKSSFPKGGSGVSENPLESPLFREFSQKFPISAETAARFAVSDQETAAAIARLLPVALQGPGVERVKSFIRALLEYPESDRVPYGLYHAFSIDGAFALESKEYPTGSFSCGSGLVAETLQLLYELGEYHGGFDIHHGIYDWSQLRRALDFCLSAKDPDAAWSEAIRSQYDARA